MKAIIDPIVWNDAKDNDLMIVSKDACHCLLSHNRTENLQLHSNQ
ncbi:hypothetical protein H6F39_13535 [Anabaena sp. FACHB-1250]|nr:hypothetical protein [Anabaena sp. FACHB-1250]MBD2269842.1 hypothetical protein [Anabaena sp. FACHB-1391]